MPAANHKTPLVSIEISDECNFSLFASNNTNNTYPTDLRWTIADVDGDSLHHGYLSSALRHTAMLDTRLAVATVFIMPSSLSLPTQYAVCAWHFSNASLDLSDCPALVCIELSYHQSALYYCHHHQLPLTHNPPPPPTPPPPLSSHPFPFSPFQHFGSLADLVMSQYSKVQTPTITELSEANHTCPSSISVLRAHHAHRPQLHCPLHQLLHYI